MSRRINCWIACLLILVMAQFAFAAEDGQHLFILSGQSNMAGLNPELSFTPAVNAEFGAGNVTVVKDAVGGQPIRRWYKKWEPAPGVTAIKEKQPRGNLYDRLMKKVKKASAGKQFATVTFVWMQGERDARESNGDVYAASFQGLLGQLKDVLNRDDIGVVIGRLSDCGMDNKTFPHWTMVRDAQVSVAEAHPRAAWVDTDSFNDGLNRKGKKVANDLHYTVEGYKMLGQRFAEEAIKLIRGSSNESSETITNRGKIRFEDVKDPNLTVYQVTRAEPTPAVIYCPGGGYHHLTPKPPIVEWLNECGVTVFMLKYTVPDAREAAIGGTLGQRDQ